MLLLAATTAAAADSAPACPACAEWNAPQKPFAVFGNTYYVGVRGLSAILVTSPAGHLLIDGGLPQSAPRIAANIRALGFRIEDVKLILVSHAHFDHAGGLAELQRLSDATVVASPSAALALVNGQVGRDDPQYGAATPFPPVSDMRVARNGETLIGSPVPVTAYFTPGHTPGGVSWTWKACEGARCLHIVYADSLDPVSADGFKFGASADYPNALADFERSFKTLATLSCDILLSAHPEFSDTWGRLAKQREAGSNAFVDTQACRKYVAAAHAKLNQRIAAER